MLLTMQIMSYITIYYIIYNMTYYCACQCNIVSDALIVRRGIKISLQETNLRCHYWKRS